MGHTPKATVVTPGDFPTVNGRVFVSSGLCMVISQYVTVAKNSYPPNSFVYTREEVKVTPGLW